MKTIYKSEIVLLRSIWKLVAHLSIIKKYQSPKKVRNANCKMSQNGVIDGMTTLKINGMINSSDAQKSTDQVDTKRQEYLSWEDYFMSVAFLSAMRSKDPSTQVLNFNPLDFSLFNDSLVFFKVGATIVNDEKKIVGIGYNGFPKGCSDDELPWGKTDQDKFKTKYMYVCHAEMNAILNKNTADIKDCTMYVALFPCNECAKMIIQSGLKEIVYFSDKHAEKDSTKASKRMLDMAGIKYRQYSPKQNKIVIDFDIINDL